VLVFLGVGSASAFAVDWGYSRVSFCVFCFIVVVFGGFFAVVGLVDLVVGFPWGFRGFPCVGLFSGGFGRCGGGLEGWGKWGNWTPSKKKKNPEEKKKKKKKPQRALESEARTKRGNQLSPKRRRMGRVKRGK